MSHMGDFVATDFKACLASSSITFLVVQCKMYVYKIRIVSAGADLSSLVLFRVILTVPHTVSFGVCSEFIHCDTANFA